MTLGVRGKTVLFLTDPQDALVREFARESSDLGLCFLSGGTQADWWVTWLPDDHGELQASLGHLPSGASHFLGTDPQRAMRDAVRLITEWDSLEGAYTTLAVH